MDAGHVDTDDERRKAIPDQNRTGKIAPIGVGALRGRHAGITDDAARIPLCHVPGVSRPYWPAHRVTRDGYLGLARALCRPTGRRPLLGPCLCGGAHTLADRQSHGAGPGLHGPHRRDFDFSGPLPRTYHACSKATVPGHPGTIAALPASQQRVRPHPGRGGVCERGGSLHVAERRSCVEDYPSVNPALVALLSPGMGSFPVYSCLVASTTALAALVANTAP